MKFNFEGGKKKLLTTLGLAAATVPAIGQGPSVEKKADQEFASNKTKIEYVSKNADKDFSGGERKVKEVPQGYVKDRVEGNRTYYKKTDDGKKLELAKPGSGTGSPEYEKWLIEMLKNGTSPRELARKRYISAEAMAEYQQYYRAPIVDMVFTETEKSTTENPFAAYAEIGEMLYGPNKHAAAEMFVSTRDTKSITDPGNLNTAKATSSVLIRFRDDFGFTGEYIVIPLSEVQKYFGTGKEFQSQELYNELKTRAKEFSESKKSPDKKDDTTANFADFASTQK